VGVRRPLSWIMMRCVCFSLVLSLCVTYKLFPGKIITSSTFPSRSSNPLHHHYFIEIFMLIFTNMHLLI
jgi:hypothetical protein